MSAEHGYSPYTHGCRCQVCRDAKADYQRARRRTALETARAATDTSCRGADRTGKVRHIVPTAKHGSAASYVELGCRCWDCTDAISAKRAAESRRQRARVRETASP